jgi:hypothetical protein
MGNRANIIILSGDEQVCLYTHWGREDLPHTLRNALIRGRERWGDYQYLTRIIFCEMIPPNARLTLTGYGITQEVHDGRDSVISALVDSQEVIIGDRPPMSFSDYIASSVGWE